MDLLSGACLHELHDKCTGPHCEFCDEPCGCYCHDQVFITESGRAYLERQKGVREEEVVL